MARIFVTLVALTFAVCTITGCRAEVDADTASSIPAAR